jgi:DNA-binding CsgD family transcriptional regulator
MDEEAFDGRIPSQREYVHDFCYPHGIRWVLGGKVSEDAHGVTVLGLQRRFGRPAFRSDDPAIRSQLTAHLQRATRIASTMEALRRENAVLSEALHAFASAAVVVDGDGKVRYANRTAQSRLAAGSACRLRMGHLACTNPASDRKLTTAVRAACQKPTRATAFLLSGPGGELHARVVPVRESASAAFGWTEPLALVVLADPEARHPSADLLRQLFGLTSAEARVVSALARGQSLERIAASTGVSRNTLRTQLASAFGKTGTTSQAQLVSLARTLPDLAVDD